jgi:hypothetical protein
MNKIQISQKIENYRNKTFDELLQFVKKSFCYHPYKFEYSEIFWNSILPLKWIKEFSFNYFFEEMLIGYFSKGENANPEFLSTTTRSSPDLLIKIIKLTKAFENQEHWESFGFFNDHENINFRNLYKELKFIKGYIARWDDKAQYFISVVKQYDYEDILIHTISYYEKFKRSSYKTTNNRNYIVMIEMNLNAVFNEILNIKLKNDFVLNREINGKYSKSEFEKILEETLPPVLPSENLLKGDFKLDEQATDEKELIRETIEFFYQYHSVKVTIDQYLTGLMEFTMIDEKEAELITNREFIVYKRNDFKTTYEEMLYTNKATENLEFLDEIRNVESISGKELLLSIYSASEYFKYLKLPLKFKSKEGKQIDFGKIFRFLKMFSKFLMPSGRIIPVSFEDSKEGIKIEANNIFRKSKTDEFSENFTENYIVCFGENELPAICEVYFNWDREEVENIIEYLTTELCLSNDYKHFDYLEKPIIKIGSQYFWLSSLLRDRRWEIMMHKRIVSEKINDHFSQAQKMEESIANEFISAGFSAVPSYKYKSSEIDTLAYKDKTLFVIELKTTYLEENMIRTLKYEAQTFSYKASEQLEKHINYIRDNFEEIKSLKGLKIDCNTEEIKIIPLIVSNTSDSDDHILHDKFLKVSLFELMIILRNDLYDMLNLKVGKVLFENEVDIPLPMIKQIQNQFAYDFKQGTIQTDKETCNLWTDDSKCSANDLISAIKEDKVWGFLDELKEFSIPQTMILKEYDPSYKFLE